MEYLNLKWPHFSHFYTDGSVLETHSKSSFGVFCPQHKVFIAETLHQHASIFTTELAAIYIAVKKILVDSIPKSLVISDSMSILCALDNCLPGFACTNNLLWDIQVMIHEIHNQHRNNLFSVDTQP
ncbi:hypothetical protein Trydic_g20461 [Trypoxylus dichotomus]